MTTTPHRLTALRLAAALMCAPLLATAPLPASAQVAAHNAVPRITAFDVANIDRIEPGAELAFTLWGTPGAQASLQVQGAGRPLQLSETSPGVYQGTYTVSRRDQIAPDASVTANLRQGNRVGTAALDEPLVRNLPAARPAMAVADGPQISRFSVTPGGDGRTGTLIHLEATGTPGAQVSVQLPGSRGGRVLLHEDAPGLYRATYRVTADDRLDTQAPLTARLRVGERSVTTTLDRALSAVPMSAPLAVAPPCGNCGRVEAINRMQVEGNGNVLGTVAGGLLGAVVGSQFGGGSGRTAAGVAGAVGGALLGREVQRKSNQREQYEVVLRMDDGQRNVLHLDNAPAARVGDAVRVVDGALQPLGG
jgi:hypothetical protein